MFENIGLESSWGCKRMQSGSSSRSRRDRDQQLKQTQSRGMKADAIGGKAGRRNRGAAALHRELSGAGLLTVGERGGSS